ncbi:MAG: GMC family oxidoreductase [Myxococcales bacterium]|nr:GMC family oxidoreductase [Myxococcales bacterium]
MNPTSARDLSVGELSCEALVIGSGAGGAVAAAKLAEAGISVLVVEEGPYVKPAEYAAMRPSQSMGALWRDGGMTIAWPKGKSPLINVTMGKCVGGSSVLTGGVCLRPPAAVHREWVEQHHLPELAQELMGPYFEEVEEAIHVETVPIDMRSAGASRFIAGAERLGIKMESLTRNTTGCQGCGRCNFGCPKQAKLSVDVTYLPRACAKGARIVSDLRVDRVIIEGGSARGAIARMVLPDGKLGKTIHIQADRVVMAAGSFHSPAILGRSGVRSKHLGRNLSLHPSFRMSGMFDEPVESWKGALQAAYSTHFEEELITLVGVFVPPAVVCATLPGFGAEHADRTAKLPYVGMFGGLIHDSAGGRVRRGLTREPVMTYRMSSPDRMAIYKALKIMAQVFVAGGATEVLLPVLGLDPLPADTVDSFPYESIPPIRLECTSQHPLGTCRMGSDPNNSVVDERGAVWNISRLHVADGSTMPTSLGVNPQLTIMTMATRIAECITAAHRTGS